jgi:toxin ParE1/3/4
MPSAFPSREDLAAGLQMAVHGNYLIFFRLQDEAVRIERIIHGARRIGDLV